MPSERESNAATQHGRARNDYHQSEEKQGDDSAEDETAKEQRRQGYRKAARRMRPMSV